MHQIPHYCPDEPDMSIDSRNLDVASGEDGVVKFLSLRRTREVLDQCIRRSE